MLEGKDEINKAKHILQHTPQKINKAIRYIGENHQSTTTKEK